MSRGMVLFVAVVVMVLACAGVALWLFTVPGREGDAQQLATIVGAGVLWLAFVVEDWTSGNGPE